METAGGLVPGFVTPSRSPNPSPLSGTLAAWVQIELCHLLAVYLGYSRNFSLLNCIFWKVGWY